jgi:hypothetical protein
MNPTLYLSGRSKNGPTQILRVVDRTIAQTLTLAELLGLDENTVLICLWPAEFDHYPKIEITPSVQFVVWPGRQAA